MKVAIFSTKPYDRQFLTQANNGLEQPHELVFHEAQLNSDTSLLAYGCDAVCCFVNDHVDAVVVHQLAAQGIKLVALRCAGFNQIDLNEAKKLGIAIARVAEYSPHAVAEHTLGLILMLNRNLHRAYHRTRENDYSLNGLLGFVYLKKRSVLLAPGKSGLRLHTSCKALAAK